MGEAGEVLFCKFTNPGLRKFKVAWVFYCCNEAAKHASINLKNVHLDGKHLIIKQISKSIGGVGGGPKARLSNPLGLASSCRHADNHGLVGSHPYGGDEGLEEPIPAPAVVEAKEEEFSEGSGRHQLDGSAKAVSSLRSVNVSKLGSQPQANKRQPLLMKSQQTQKLRSETDDMEHFVPLKQQQPHMNQSLQRNPAPSKKRNLAARQLGNASRPRNRNQNRTILAGPSQNRLPQQRKQIAKKTQVAKKMAGNPGQTSQKPTTINTSNRTVITTQPKQEDLVSITGLRKSGLLVNGCYTVLGPGVQPGPGSAPKPRARQYRQQQRGRRTIVPLRNNYQHQGRKQLQGPARKTQQPVKKQMPQRNWQRQGRGRGRMGNGRGGRGGYVQGRGQPRTPGSYVDPNRTVVISNLAPGTKWMQLSDHLASSGARVDTVISHAYGPGTAEAVFKTQKDAGNAVFLLNNSRLNNQNIVMTSLKNYGGWDL